MLAEARRFLFVLCAVPVVAYAAEAPSDSVEAPADTIRATSRYTFSPVATPPATLPGSRVIEMLPERKVGVASLEDLLRFRRGHLVEALPLFGPTQGEIALPDGGGFVGLDGWTSREEHATDEPLIGSIALGWGAPWLASALHDPRSDAIETLDLDAVAFPLDRNEFRGPGESMTRPAPRGAAFARLPADTVPGKSARTTLVYRRGAGNAQLTGIRFQARTFRRGVYASFARNQADGWAPLRESLTERYALRAELGRVGSHRFDLEGLLYKRWIEDSITTLPERGGMNEWARREVGVRAIREGKRSSDAWSVRLGNSKETWVRSTDANLSPEPGARERWEFPGVAAEGSMTWRPTPAITWIASAQAASRKIVYRTDSLPEFEPRREEGRARLGGRYAIGTGGVGFDAAYDVRETQAGFLDGRISFWGGDHARLRLDLESAHDRPSWVDLLTPPRLRLFASQDFTLTNLFRSGDPSLKPRRLTGALGSAGMTLLPGLDVELSGSYRHVTDDFGWSVTSDTTGGGFTVSSIAGPRGSGWLSHAAFGWELRRGAFRTRGAAWVRGGPDSLSPQSGSPPRRAVDAAADLRVVLFQGDLPLRFGVESHARGPRQGLIREPAQVTWDGSLSADFGSAGAFIRVQDVFDKSPGSAIWDPTIPSGAPLPGRTFQAGVTWNLLD
jgi:hypothetical protein